MRPRFLGVGGHDHALVDGLAHFLDLQVAVGGDRAEHVVVQVVDQRGHVLADRLAEAVAGVGLGGAFVVAHVEHVGLDAELGRAGPCRTRTRRGRRG